MSTPWNAMPEARLGSQGIAPVAMSTTQPMYWSVRRELWENRSIYIAPLTAAALILAGFLLSTIHLARNMRAAMALDPMQQQELIERPYILASLLIMGTTFIVAIIYCLDALHSERRDRSILFWKSLPVSDLITVLSKATIPLVILPLLTFAITAITQSIMLIFSAVVLAGSDVGVRTLWTHLSLGHMWLMLIYHLLAIHALWYAPIYSWLLLVSGWARRAPFLWAALPLLAIGIVEKIAFNTTYFGAMLGYRMSGPGDGAPTPIHMSMDSMTRVTLSRLLINPSLWTGLAVAALFLALAVRLRRYREPI